MMPRSTSGKASRKQSRGAHLQHAQRVLRPRPGLIPKAGALGIGDRKGTSDRRGALARRCTHGGNLVAGTSDTFNDILAERRAAHERQHRIAVHCGLAVYNGDTLQCLERPEAELGTPLDCEQNVGRLALVLARHHRRFG